MKHILTGVFLTINLLTLYPQVVLTIEGKIINDTETGTSMGVVIPNNLRTLLTYRNNSITAVCSAGYMLCAGDEVPGPYNNNLDGADFTGNKFIWQGTDESSTTHGLFTGYNLDVTIKYNYFSGIPNGIQRKSNGMTDQTGVIAYNIIRNPGLVGIVAKGMNRVKIYNNTFYSEKTSAQTSRGLIDIHTNYDNGLSASSTGTKIFNNIFYTKHPIINIKIYESVCLTDFESDYNVFWCETGEPIFEVAGVKRTFSQWQAMGYDKHSVVINPEFKDFIDFVPIVRLDYGKDLGVEMLKGLSVTATWGTTDPETTSQNGIWQVGARIYESNSSKVKIYPNPALNAFYVLISASSIPYSRLSLYDLNGHKVFDNELRLGTNLIPIPSFLSSGLYNIILETDKKEQHKEKIMIIE